MDLEELQLAWTQMGKELETQKKLTKDIIMEMTQSKYRNKFSKISNYEKLGTILCFGIASIIIFHFGALDTWYLRLFGLLALVFLIIMPVLVLTALKQIQGLDIVSGTYSETLIKYTKSKARLLRLQQLSIGVSFIMLFLVIPITAKIFNNKDVFSTSFRAEQWIGFSLVFVGMVFFSRWGYRSYQKITDSAALLLNDLKE